MVNFTQVKSQCDEKKGIEILQLTLQHHHKFLKEREKKQLLQVKIMGLGGMGVHH